jgi:hypothetical protein
MSQDAARCGMVVLLSLAVAGSGCGEDSSGSAQRERPTLTIDERGGTFRGVGLASSSAEIEHEFGGNPEPYSKEHGVTPAGHSFYELGLPDEITAPDPAATARELAPGVLRYRDASFQTTEDDGAYAFSVVSPARTPRGVAIGHRLRGVRRRYPGFRCGVRNRRRPDIAYPFCTGRVVSGVHLWFGNDPIRSITLASKPMLASPSRGAENEP